MKKIKIFADGANEKEILKFDKMQIIKGLTTNPSLMKKSGVKNYEVFCKKILKKIKKPISFEIFSDDEKNIIRQAKIISSWSKNVYVKIPVINTKNKSLSSVIKILSNEGVKLNITAVFTKKQIRSVFNSLNTKTPAIISIFCGRISDAGNDVTEYINYANKLKRKKKNVEILWASTRELYSIVKAEKLRCDIITVPTEILNKIKIIGKNLDKYSLETVQMFYNDAKKAGFKL
tara:strand:+ start:6239 stop:6937 length:699 start_codon:yes stop_codon:yes gene_type:complete